MSTQKIEIDDLSKLSDDEFVAHIRELVETEVPPIGNLASAKEKLEHQDLVFARGLKFLSIAQIPVVRRILDLLDRSAFEVRDARKMANVGADCPEPKGDGFTYGIIDPEYARIYTMARTLAWQEGYAICLHGSFTRDLDLMAIPWTAQPCTPKHLVNRILDATGLRSLDKEATVKDHGRLSWTLVLPSFADPRFVDFSVMPPIGSVNE